MNETQIIALINQWIIANGNNEITADVLRPILLAMVEQPNNLIGDLSELATTDTATLVNAINSVLDEIENIDSDSVKLYTGLDNPNVTPPDSFNIADFYAQYDVNNNLVDLLQYNGVNWVSTNPSDNGFVTQGTIEKSGNDYIVSTGFSWIINDILYSNNSGQTFTIQPAGTNESRVDIIVTNGNEFELIQGTPSTGEGTASQPPIPVGSILLTSIIIFENTISEPIPPIIGETYVTKASLQVQNYTPNSATNGLPVDASNLTTKYNLTSATNYSIPGIASIDAYGIEPIVHIRTVSPKTFQNNALVTGVVPFTGLPGGTNFVTDANGIISFMRVGNAYVFQNYSLGGTLETLQTVMTRGNTTDKTLVYTGTGDAIIATNSAGAGIGLGFDGMIKWGDSGGVELKLLYGAYTRLTANRLIEYIGSTPTTFTGRQIPDANWLNSVLALKANLSGNNIFIGENSISQNNISKPPLPTGPNIMTQKAFGLYKGDGGMAMNFGVSDDGVDIYSWIQAQYVNYGGVFGDLAFNPLGGNTAIGKAKATEKLDVNGNAKLSGLFFLGQFTNGTEPAYQKGATYFNTSINKIKIGGAMAWETVTSI